MHLYTGVGIDTEKIVENRIMYTVGQALLEMGVFGKEIRIIYGIPLSISEKNPFFDRKTEELTKK